MWGGGNNNYGGGMGDVPGGLNSKSYHFSFRLIPIAIRTGWTFGDFDRFVLNIAQEFKCYFL
jgi:hypothetical protein